MLYTNHSSYILLMIQLDVRSIAPEVKFNVSRKSWKWGCLYKKKISRG